ncbi:hypothetical protein [uncultured Microbulbifer sp.]|uniref:hypothetical protein n=1 Tax=uncultured Microbulbifer sp. TaxID=348147 RepID=UPI0034510F30
MRAISGNASTTKKVRSLPPKILSATTQYGYNPVGLIGSVTDPLGNTTRYLWNPEGKLAAPSTTATTALAAWKKYNTLLARSLATNTTPRTVSMR